MDAADDFGIARQTGPNAFTFGCEDLATSQLLDTQGIETALEAIIDAADAEIDFADPCGAWYKTLKCIDVEDSLQIPDVSFRDPICSDETSPVRKRRALEADVEAPSRKFEDAVRKETGAGDAAQWASWAQAWPELQRRGWRIEYGPRGKDMQIYYMPPGVERGAGSRPRRDYFDSKICVLRYLREGSVVDHDATLGRPNRKRIATPMQCFSQTSKAQFLGTANLALPSSRRGGVAQCKSPHKAMESCGAFSSTILQGWCVVATGFQLHETSEVKACAIQCGAHFLDGMPHPLPRNALLAVVARQPVITPKFLTALALGVPPVSRKWLEDTARAGFPKVPAEYSLALKSEASQRCLESFKPRSRCMFGSGRLSVGVNICGSISFQEQWAPVLRVAGASVVAPVDASCRYILAEHQAQFRDTELRRFKEWSVRIVGLDWLKASLLVQQEISAVVDVDGC